MEYYVVGLENFHHKKSAQEEKRAKGKACTIHCLHIQLFLSSTFAIYLTETLIVLCVGDSSNQLPTREI